VFLDAEVTQMIKARRRKMSATGPRKGSTFEGNEFAFVKETKVRTKDDNRFQANSRNIRFKVSFPVITAPT
jgi:hypothetical protein